MADLKCGILGTAIGFTDGGGRRHKGLDPVQRGRNPPKHGLRGWNSDRSEMTKGITLTKDELTILQQKLHKIKL